MHTTLIDTSYTWLLLASTFVYSLARKVQETVRSITWCIPLETSSGNVRSRRLSISIRVLFILSLRSHGYEMYSPFSLKSLDSACDLHHMTDTIRVTETDVVVYCTV